MPFRLTSQSSRRACILCLSVGVLVCFPLLFQSASASELRMTAIVKAVQGARSSVVNIRGEKTIASSHSDSSAGNRRVNGMGTGVVIDPRGYIVTNYHVVDGVRQIRVTLADKSRFTARLIAHDMETDLAIIKIDANKKLPVITLGTSSDLMPGETVIAMGNAYGYENSVTRGIISALHRAVPVSDAQFYDDLIQVDAAINPGNSGGPLLNIDGEMIGINVAVRAGAQSIGFAIPVNKAMAITAQLLGSHMSRTTWHGVVPGGDGDMTSAGVLVGSIDKKSPAEKCGLHSGDHITTVNGDAICGAVGFQRAMLDRKVGQSVQLEVNRGGEPIKVKMTLVSIPRKRKQPASPVWEALGLRLKPLPESQFRQRYKTRYRGGLSIVDVRSGSAAASQGIRRGDVLVGMHVWETVSLDNVDYIINRPDFSKINPVKFFILRGDETLYGYLSVAAKPSKRK
jgi:serine protease Do